MTPQNKKAWLPQKKKGWVKKEDQGREESKEWRQNSVKEIKCVIENHPTKKKKNLTQIQMATLSWILLIIQGRGNITLT